MFMRHLADIMLQRPEPELQEVLESALKEIGLGCRKLGEEIKRLPEFVDEKSVEIKWVLRARLIKEGSESAYQPQRDASYKAT